ncbi:MAG: ATP-binding protein [Verrucomicrobiales bacterium]|nr:ATP-binding protein [Verrucomicrobiales bacterium]
MALTHPIRKNRRFSLFRQGKPIPRGAASRFLLEERNSTLHNIRLVAIFTAILFPLFSVVDYFTYREHFGLFLVFRLACSAAIFLIFKLTFTAPGRKYYRALTVVLPMLPAVVIALMIAFSKDPGSPYYAGLSLCLCAIGFAFHWSYQEALLASLSILLMFLVACLPGVWTGTSLDAVFSCITNMIFIAATGVVISAGSFVHHRIKVNEFMAREELRKSRSALSAKNRELINLVDELQETESQLIQSEKMASLGQLSAGVIHEIGNPLNYTNQALYHLRKKVNQEDYSSLPGIIDDVQEGYNRITDIVSELREFSHNGGGQSTNFSVDESIHSALRMLRKEIEKHNIQVSVEVDHPIEIPGVKNQITQVIMNVVQNSIQAIESSIQSNSGKIRIVCTKIGDTAQVSVSDNGPGVPRELEKRIFDPFFTTKQPGEGIGLGLSICYRIIESHGGTLDVQTRPGDTRFTISLPGARPSLSLCRKKTA